MFKFHPVNVRALYIEILQHLLLSECLLLWKKRCDPTYQILLKLSYLECSRAPALHSELHTNLSKQQKTRLIFLNKSGFGTFAPFWEVVNCLEMCGVSSYLICCWRISEQKLQSEGYCS